MSTRMTVVEPSKRPQGERGVKHSQGHAIDSPYEKSALVKVGEKSTDPERPPRRGGFLESDNSESRCDKKKTLLEIRTE